MNKITKKNEHLFNKIKHAKFHDSISGVPYRFSPLNNIPEVIIKSSHDKSLVAKMGQLLTIGPHCRLGFSIGIYQRKTNGHTKEVNDESDEFYRGNMILNEFDSAYLTENPYTRSTEILKRYKNKLKKIDFI